MAVFVCGALHHDVIVSAPRLPRPDETLVGSRVRYAFGGKGGNQAVAAARMGATVAMAGAVGTDAAGAFLLQGLAAAGVEASQVARVDGPSGMSVALLEPTGAYAAVIVPGPNLAIDPAGVRLPEGTRLLLLQNEIPEPVNLALARKARARGVGVILNAAPARAMASELLRLTDILVVNRVEAADLCGRDDRAALAALAAKGPPRVIVTLGARGLWLRDGGDERQMPAHPVAVRSTHGAGDAFIGALAAELARSGELADACAFAQGAAALHVAASAERRGDIRRDDVRRFLAGGRI